MPPEPILVGRHHAVLGEFRRIFKSGPLAAKPDGAAGAPARTASFAGPWLGIEGPRLLGEALRSGFRLDKALFSRTGLQHHGDKLVPQFSKHTQALLVEDGVFAACMEVEHPQGVAALVRFPLPALDAVFGSGEREPLVVAAAEMQDPGNLGALIRAADAFGATGVVALQDTVSPFNAKAVRASAGSLFHLPVVGKVSVGELVAACRQRGVRMLATAARGPAEASAAQLLGPICLLIGQEGAGVPRELLRAADATVSIPMASGIESLNAGVAGSIFLYEAARQRRL